eukprot:2159649-Prymnesium_polylepis.1
MDTAIANGDLNPTGASAILMHNKIYNMLILTFKGEYGVMDEMEAQCGKLGAGLHVLPRGPVQLDEPRCG